MSEVTNMTNSNKLQGVKIMDNNKNHKNENKDLITGIIGRELDTEDITKICMYLAHDVLTKSSNLDGVLNQLYTPNDVENYNKTLVNVLNHYTTTINNNIDGGNGIGHKEA